MVEHGEKGNAYDSSDDNSHMNTDLSSLYEGSDSSNSPAGFKVRGRQDTAALLGSNLEVHEESDSSEGDEHDELLDWVEWRIQKQIRKCFAQRIRDMTPSIQEMVDSKLLPFAIDRARTICAKTLNMWEQENPETDNSTINTGAASLRGQYMYEVIRKGSSDIVGSSSLTRLFSTMNQEEGTNYNAQSVFNLFRTQSGNVVVTYKDLSIRRRPVISETMWLSQKVKDGTLRYIS